jgi:hypothetical protein
MCLKLLDVRSDVQHTTDREERPGAATHLNTIVAAAANCDEHALPCGAMLLRRNNALPCGAQRINKATQPLTHA